MKYLGSERSVTQSFANHKYAEDYSGAHLSAIKINGTAKVIKVVNKYKGHNNSINYREFLNNQKKWKDGNYYNCISITGETVRFYYDETGGNQVHLETYYNGSKYLMKILHMNVVNVKVGDIVNKNTVIGLQGNTGLVLSSKSRTDVTYGSHVHLEVKDSSGKSINPRAFADGSIEYNYTSQSNIVDESKKQFKVLVQTINIRKEPSELSEDIGDVHYDEVYDILGEVDSSLYTWYKIKTNRGIEGYVASKKDSNWVLVSNPGNSVIDVDEGTDEEEKDEKIELIFECQNDGIYYLKMKNGEKLYLQKKS